jgi:hypothetical protein
VNDANEGWEVVGFTAGGTIVRGGKEFCDPVMVNMETLKLQGKRIVSSLLAPPPHPPNPALTLPCLAAASAVTHW